MFLKQNQNNILHNKFFKTFLIMVLFLVFPKISKAYTCTWTGTTSTAWATATNWSGCNSTIPQTTDDVVINTAVANQPIVDLSAGSKTIKSLSIGSSLASTLTFSNGFTNQLIITGNLTIGGSGTITHTANTTTATHAVRIQVNGNATIASGGKIDVSGRGLAGGASNYDDGYNGYIYPNGGGGGGKKIQIVSVVVVEEVAMEEREE